jgi:hypothetical protein
MTLQRRDGCRQSMGRAHVQRNRGLVIPHHHVPTVTAPPPPPPLPPPPPVHGPNTGAPQAPEASLLQRRGPALRPRRVPARTQQQRMGRAARPWQQRRPGRPHHASPGRLCQLCHQVQVRSVAQPLDTQPAAVSGVALLVASAGWAPNRALAAGWCWEVALQGGMGWWLGTAMTQQLPLSAGLQCTVGL